jgi:EmrB/QacA subfamily drug resistance transporter
MRCEGLTGVVHRCLIVALLAAGLAMLASPAPPASATQARHAGPFLYSDLLSAIRSRQVVRAVLDPQHETAVVWLVGGRREDVAVTAPGDLADRLTAAGASVEVRRPGGRAWMFPLAMLLLFVGVAGGRALWLRRRPSLNEPGNADRPEAVSRARRPAVRFADVAGCDEAVEEVREFVEFLRNPGQFARVGARMPSGLLLHGPSGTGKTLLAKALAGEAQVQFFAASGSDFMERYVGVGASRVRQLFARARTAAGGAVVFIDEVDAIGKRRGDASEAGNGEHDHTLNQLLVELDGFDCRQRVVCVAATNRIELLDPALLRPGRLSRHVLVDLPSAEGRRAILEVHARGKPFSADVDLDRLAQGTAGRSGADLADVLNEGAIVAARAVIAVAQLMVVLDVTIVNIALPSAQSALGFSTANRQWIITAYALAFGSLLLLGGRLGDLFGRKWTFIGGLLGFAAVSAIGGAAQSFGMLVGARALQGVFGAVLAPSALGLLSTTFTEPPDRAKAFAIFGAIAAGGSAVGLLLGGFLTELLSWRWCLFVNLLIAIPTALAAFRLVVNQPQPNRPRLDLRGTATVSLGLFALVYGFSNSERHSWGDTMTIVSLVAAVVLLTWFVAIEVRSDQPLLPLRVITDRTRAGSYLALGVSAVSLFGVSLFLTFYLQRTKGFSPIETGLAFLPLSAAIVVVATSVSTVLLRRVGPRPLLTLGMLLGAASLVWLAQLTPSSSYAGHVLPALIVLGVGLGNIFPAGIATATYGVDRQDAGVASAMVNTMQQVGGSIGTALLSSIFASAVTAYAANQPHTPEVLSQATVHGYTVAFWVAAGIFAVGALVVGGIMRSIHLAGVERSEPTAEPIAA